MNNDKDPWINRKQAYRRTGYSPSSYSTWDSRKTYDLKPRKRRGIVEYRQSVIDAHRAGRLIRQGKTLKAK
jgi:hypothetical protein